jgi:outer membrane protein assembly factor BamB
MSQRKTVAIALLTGSILSSGANWLVGAARAVDPEVLSVQAKPTQDPQTENGPGRNLPRLVRVLDTQHIGSGPLAYAPDGQTLATSGGPGQVRLWDPATGEQRGLLKINQELPPYVHALAFSPDGRTLAVGYASEKDKLAVRLWDVRTAQVTRALRVERGTAGAVAFSPEGKLLAGGETSGHVYLWDTATGQELHRLEREERYARGAYGIAFSPDGKWVAAGGGKVGVWDVASGQKLRRVDTAAFAFHVAFSADSRTLLGAGTYYPPQPVMTTAAHPAFYLWALPSGKEHCLVDWQVPVPGRGGYVYQALSPDGRTLVTLGGRDQVCLWEVATFRPRWALPPQDLGNCPVVFSPDGRTLATLAGQRYVHLWDVLALSANDKVPAQPPSRQALEALWRDLGSDDAAKGYSALCNLVHWPDHTVPFLQQRLQPIPKAQVQRIAQLIADLDSPQFAVRQRATAELEQLGDAAEPALQDLLAGKPSLEVRQRAERLLTKLRAAPISGERLRVRRAMEVLEYIGAPAVRPVLESLARGAPEDQLTQEAKAALKRLTKRWAAAP